MKYKIYKQKDVTFGSSASSFLLDPSEVFLAPRDEGFFGRYCGEALLYTKTQKAYLSNMWKTQTLRRVVLCWMKESRF